MFYTSSGHVMSSALHKTMISPSLSFLADVKRSTAALPVHRNGKASLRKQLLQYDAIGLG